MVWAHSEAEIDASVRHDEMRAEMTRRASAKLLRALWRDHSPILRRLRGEQTPKRVRKPYEFDPPRRAIDIVGHVASAFGLDAEDITGKDRGAHLVDARSVVAKLLRERNHSYPQIGVVLGGRDHSTIINLIDKFDIYERRNPLVGMAFEELRIRRAAA